VTIPTEFEESPATDFPASRSFESDLSLINSWVADCMLNHAECKEGPTNWYPTRLLHLGRQGQDVRLIISEEEPPNGVYATLSHRWGEHKYETLSPSSMGRLKTGVIVSTLPQIFQDSIQIARHLDINYLWIDGLCIQQGEDYRADWVRESQQMGKIYTHAFLNISAALSETGMESLFARGPWSAAIPAHVEIDLNGRPEQYHVLDGDLWKNEVDEAPLSRRGWVFQERILAKRVIHFGPSQIAWECRELDALEMFQHGLPARAALSTMRKQNILHNGPTTAQGHGSDLDSFVDEWHEIVTAYSRCALTKEGDKLVAFLGVAQRLMQSRADVYVAGMWEKTLVYDLAWVRSEMDIQSFPLSATRHRAPSWSWASVDGEVTFPAMNGGVWRHFVSEVKLWPVGDETTPAAGSAKVQARGMCLPLRLIHTNGRLSGVEVPGLRFSTDGGGPNQAIALEDSAPGVLASIAAGHLLFLPLFSTPYLLTGLMLAAVGTGACNRIGALHLELTAGEGAEPSAQLGDGGKGHDGSVQPAMVLHQMIVKHRRHSCLVEIF
jgi:hypothetical protein